MSEAVELRQARAEDYDFALALYVETIKPYTIAFMPWVDAVESARFAKLWAPADTRIITLDGAAIGWVEATDTGAELVLKQFYIAPAQQQRGIGTQVMELLLTEWQATGRPIVLNVLKNNPARRLYQRLGFATVGETDMKFLMRREAGDRVKR
jgi:ribosomal protein S18 acetylase RimI-like enzyme